MSCGDAEVVAILEEVVGRVKRSIEIHGDWSDYDQGQVFEAVAGEFDEYREAVVSSQVVGRHGQVDELYDLVVTALKGIKKLTGMTPKPCMSIGRFQVFRTEPGKVWISRDGLEGGQFPEVGLEQAIEHYFGENF